MGKRDRTVMEVLPIYDIKVTLTQHKPLMAKACGNEHKRVHGLHWVPNDDPRHMYIYINKSLKGAELAGTVSHECMHAVLSVNDIIGYGRIMEHANEEHSAYILTWLVEWVISTIKEWNKH